MKTILGGTFLTDRCEIAQAINIDRYPTFVFDITKHYKDYEGYYRTEPCFNLVDHTSRYGDMHYSSTLYIEIPMDREHKQVTLDDMVNNVRVGKGDVCCISSSFTSHDVLEMARNRALQDVRGGDTVIVVFVAEDVTFVQKMRISKRIDPFCTTMAHLEPIAE